jgi:hypothetical protein
MFFEQAKAESPDCGDLALQYFPRKELDAGNGTGSIS